MVRTGVLRTTVLSVLGDRRGLDRLSKALEQCSELSTCNLIIDEPEALEDSLVKLSTDDDRAGGVLATAVLGEQQGAGLVRLEQSVSLPDQPSDGPSVAFHVPVALRKDFLPS